MDCYNYLLLNRKIKMYFNQLLSIINTYDLNIFQYSYKFWLKLFKINNILLINKILTN